MALLHDIIQNVIMSWSFAMFGLFLLRFTAHWHTISHIAPKTHAISQHCLSLWFWVTKNSQKSIYLSVYLSVCPDGLPVYNRPCDLLYLHVTDAHVLVIRHASLACTWLVKAGLSSSYSKMISTLPNTISFRKPVQNGHEWYKNWYKSTQAVISFMLYTTWWYHDI